MNKRWPVIASFVLFIALCASAAYWWLQLFQPPARPVAAPPHAAAPQIDAAAAASLFGGRAGTAAASNFQLHGVIYAGNPSESVAILSADGEPARAVRVGAEAAPGVTVKEVHRSHVLLDEGGAVKRVDLPEDAEDTVSDALAAPVPARPVGQRPPPAAASAPPPASVGAGVAQDGASMQQDPAVAGRVQGGFIQPHQQQQQQAQQQDVTPGTQGQVQLPDEAPPSVVVTPGADTVQQGAPTGN